MRDPGNNRAGYGLAYVCEAYRYEPSVISLRREGGDHPGLTDLVGGGSGLLVILHLSSVRAYSFIARRRNTDD